MTSNKLPPTCAAKLPSTDKGIIIRRGEAGYYTPAAGFDVDRYNEQHGVTKPQQEAMFCGSMFGWNVPGAHPEAYDDDGTFSRDGYDAIKAAS